MAAAGTVNCELLDREKNGDFEELGE